MAMQLMKAVGIDPAYILVDAGVRYWEDAEVNGVADEDGTLIPGRAGDSWKAKISLAEGRIENWPAGTTASIHYKVCDDGRYALTDAEGTVLARLDGYVPGDFLCHGDNGYGDYIILDVGPDGKIENYERPTELSEAWEVT